MLSPVDYQEFSWQYINQIIEALKDDAPVIAFGKGCWFALGEMAKSNGELVDAGASLARMIGREIATIEEAREMLNIPKKVNS